MTFEEYYEIGQGYYKNREYYKALEHFKKCISIDNYYICLDYIGLCYLQLKHYEIATKIFKKISEDIPELATPIINLGRVYLCQGLLEKAFENFIRAIDMDSENQDAYFYLGVYFGKIKNYEESQKCYVKSLSINMEQSEVHLNLGICYYNLKFFNDALHEFRLAYSYDNKCLEARENMGLIYVEMNDYEKALEEFLIINKSQTEDVVNIVDIAHCYCQINDFHSALKWIKKAIDISPEDEFLNSMFNMINSSLKKDE